MRRLLGPSLALWLAAGAFQGADTPARLDPVPLDRVPGEGVPGTVVVDDGDPAVTINGAKGAPRKAGPEETAFGGTVLEYNGWGKAGDGKTILAVAPDLKAGRYAVWMRFTYLRKNHFGVADRAVVRLVAKKDEAEFLCNPRLGPQWFCLGVHELAGTGPVLSMSNRDVKGVAAFDAAVFVPWPSSAPGRPARLLPPGGAGFPDVIRRCAEQSIGPTDALPADPAAAQRLRDYDFQARLAWDTLERAPDRVHLWGDLKTKSSWELTEDAARLQRLANAWAGAPDALGTGMRGHPRLLADLLAAMDTFLTHRYTPNTRWDVNWWDFEIGVPRGLMAALCVLGARAPAELRAKAFAAMEHFTADPWKMYNKGFPSTGANRIWMVANHLRRAALAGDARLMERCRDGLTEVLGFVDPEAGGTVASREGWWRDGTFIQHGNLPYVGAYGALLVPDLVDALAALEGTPWAVVAPERANLARWVELGLLPVCFEGDVLPRTTGRTVGSSGIETGHEWLAIALAALRPLLPPDRSRETAGRLKRWMQLGGLAPECSRADFNRFMALNAIRNDAAIKPSGPYLASRTHAAGDMVVHHRPGWAAGVAMSSTRTASHEALWGANYRGWNQGEGVLTVWAGGPGRYRDGFWALVDPYRLPGITTNTWQLPEHDGGGASPGKPSRQAFVGGASLRDAASVAAMRVGREWSSLEARKGWFFFPDAVVCLGSGITATDGRPCETVVESARLDEPGDAVLSVDGAAVPGGAWKADLSRARTVHLAGSRPERGIGWWFPSAPGGLGGERARRSGSWKNAGKKESEAPLERWWFEMRLAHGTDPKDAGYQYAVLPGLAPEALQTFAARPSIGILACTPAAHAVSDGRHGILGAILWEAGRAGPVSADAPCIVLLQEDPSGLAVAVSEPTQLRDRLTVVLDRKAGRPKSGDPRIRVAKAEPLTLEVDAKGALGRSLSVELAK